MNRSAALKLLGLEATACDLTPEIITRAFRQAVVASHPDTASQGDSNVSHADMDLLTIAKETLLGDMKHENNACPQCRGRGTVRLRMGVTPCGACKGTGETYGR